MKTTKLTITLLINLFSFGMFAQKSEIITDRPDQSNSPSLVPQGSLQVETGFILEKDNSQIPGTLNYTYNTTLIRFGVNQNFEGRANLSYLGVQNFSDDAPKAQGLSPISLGAKIKLADQHGVWPQAAVIGNINFRSTTNTFNAPNTNADITFALSHDLSESWSLSYNAGVKWNGVDPEATWLYTVSLGLTATRRTAMFAEWYAFLPERGHCDNRVNAGLTYKICTCIQYDISGGLGLSEHSPEYFVSTGLSFRFFK